MPWQRYHGTWHLYFWERVREHEASQCYASDCTHQFYAKGFPRTIAKTQKKSLKVDLGTKSLVNLLPDTLNNMQSFFTSDLPEH